MSERLRKLALATALGGLSFLAPDLSSPVSAGGGCPDTDPNCFSDPVKVVTTSDFEIYAYPPAEGSSLFELGFRSKTRFLADLPFMPTTDEGTRKAEVAISSYCGVDGEGNLVIITGPGKSKQYALVNLDCLDSIP